MDRGRTSVCNVLVIGSGAAGMRAAIAAHEAGEHLYAAGEVTGGLHGANRLGGNSLAETIISGRRAGVAAATHADEGEVIVRSRRVIKEAMDSLDALVRPGAELARPLQRRRRDLMWERCGVVRDDAALRGALERRETRGAHNRSDFPNLDPALQVNLYARLDNGRIVLDRRPVPEPSPELAELMNVAPKIEAGADRLLE